MGIMDDLQIIDLYFARNEKAVEETRRQYGRLIRSVAMGILRSLPDAEECENDTYLKTWQAIPPARPKIFSAFVSRISRNLALDRYDQIHAARRGGGEIPLLLDELAECIPDKNSVEREIEGRELTGRLNIFLGQLEPETRNIFLRRYWFGDRIQEIAGRSGCGVSKVKMTLLRTRKALEKFLDGEGCGG